MRRHVEKIKSMERSVLPSTARESARAERRAIHRKQRARERVLLGASRATRDGDDPTGPDFREGRRRSAIHWMVADRRAADKIGPLTRWAVAIVESDATLRDAPLHEQVAHFAALLPGTMIGRHAVQHIEWALRYHRHAWPDWNAAVRERRDARHAQILADLQRIIEYGGHGELNAALRKGYQVPSGSDTAVTSAPPNRLLLGIHDIDAFAADSGALDWVRDIVTRMARHCH